MGENLVMGDGRHCCVDNGRGGIESADHADLEGLMFSLDSEEFNEETVSYTKD